ncbi:MAG TPA: PP2C family protein-serine/threonine phosphatase [Vicinamibacterales bacterium]|nr:PP2C family protein-serine/threonine phosphatase [Vicinamibacterales bacterium]
MTSARSGGRMQASLGELIRTLPARQLWLLWSAIFSTFATIAFMIDIAIGGRFPVAWLTSTALVSGALSVGFTATSLRQRWLALASLIAADIVYVVIARRVFQLLPVAPEGRFIVDAIGALVCISIGYTLFILFMNATATRHLRAQAELAVAHDIHQVLVPSIDRTIGEYEFLGWSIASGEVGGDLVDLVAIDGRWLGYVADVSGHGVGAGIVMAMFKSALRTRALTGAVSTTLLDDVQAALMPLKQPNIFVTVAWVGRGADGEVECAVAGHLPILRARAGVVEEITHPQFALGMFEGAAFTSTRVECREGDVLALLTDGLVEVFDSAGRELGFEWAKKTLAAVADRTLQEIADHLLTGARNHGAQLDDQSLLLIRRTSRP